MTPKIVHVVHCIDTEGPLYESLPETFKRLKELFDIELVPFDYSNQGMEENNSGQKDLANGRYGDWRRAPTGNLSLNK